MEGLKSTYNLNLIEGVAVIRYPFGDFVDNPDTMRELGLSLIKTANLIEKEKLSPDTLRHITARTVIEDVLADKETTWIFPPDTHPTASSKSGYVYFATNEKEFPSVIKIGCSKNPQKRMKTLANHYRVPTGTFTPIAMIKTNIDYYKDLEYMYHILFSEHRRMGEWFDLKPVLWYINYARNLYNSITKSD